MKPTILWVVALFACVLPGCSCSRGPNYSELDLVAVTGKVTMDAKPLANVMVRFEGPPGRFAEGKTNSSGNFNLMYDSNKAGCMPGEKIVRITTDGGEGSDEGSPVEGADGKVPEATKTQTIPPKYNTMSELTANVSSSNKSFTFDLKSMP